MKLLLFGAFPPKKHGIARVTYELLKEFCALSDIEELSIIAPENLVHIDPIILNHQKISLCPLKGSHRPIYLMKLTWRLIKSYRRGGILLLFSSPIGREFLSFPLGQLVPFLLLVKLGILPGSRVIQVLYDFTPYQPFYEGIHKSNMYESYRKFFANIPANYVAISQSTKNDGIQFWGLPDRKIDVVHLGSFIAPLEPRNNFGSKKILIIANIEPRKNHLRLLNAFEIVHRQIQDAELILVGAAFEDIPQSKQTCRQIELAIQDLRVRYAEIKVTVLGFLPDDELKLLLRQVDVFVYPSLYEGFGLPVLEAMACGCPVVTSNTSSLPEVTGNAALLVDPYDVDELARAIVAVLNDHTLKQDMSAKGIRQAQQFSWDKAAQEYLKIFRKLDNREKF